MSHKLEYRGPKFRITETYVVDLDTKTVSLYRNVVDELTGDFWLNPGIKMPLPVAREGYQISKRAGFIEI